HAAAHLRALGEEAQRGHERDRLAATALAHDAEGAAGDDVDVDAMERAHDVAAHVEIDNEIADREARRHRHQLRAMRKLPARKSIAKDGDGRHSIALRFAVKVAFWCSTV